MVLAEALGKMAFALMEHEYGAQRVAQDFLRGAAQEGLGQMRLTIRPDHNEIHFVQTGERNDFKEGAANPYMDFARDYARDLELEHGQKMFFGKLE
jgi:hypothetical protein